MKTMIFFGAVLLVGCGTAPPATQIVEVPVHTPCVKDVPAAPVYEFDRLPLDASDGEKVLALARDWSLAQSYEIKLTAALSQCY
jgi:hypothetical protein